MGRVSPQTTRTPPIRSHTHRDARGRLPVAQQQGEDVVLAVVAGLGDEGEVGGVGAAVGVARVLLRGLGKQYAMRGWVDRRRHRVRLILHSCSAQGQRPHTPIHTLLSHTTHPHLLHAGRRQLVGLTSPQQRIHPPLPCTPWPAPTSFM